MPTKTKTKTAIDKSPRVAKHVRVSNHAHEGYRRGGAKHAKGATTHEPNTFTEKQIDVMKGDPKLSVEFVDPPKAATAA